MRKLMIWTSLLLVSLVLVGCSFLGNTRREKFEKRFTRISEVYPTEKVEDLFEKFPRGFRIRYLVFNKQNDLKTIHEINLEGDPATKKIEGEYVKEVYNIETPLEEEVTKIPISYSDKDGIQSLDGQAIDPSIKELEFFFTKMTLNRDYLRSLDLEKINELPVSKSYTMRYHPKDKIINDYIGIPQDASVTLELGGEPEYDLKGKFHYSISVQRGLKIYFSEFVTEK